MNNKRTSQQQPTEIRSISDFERLYFPNQVREREEAAKTPEEIAEAIARELVEGLKQNLSATRNR